MNFTQEESEKLLTIIKARRDVRGGRFIDKPVEEGKLQKLLQAAIHAPSVGYSQPWEFVIIKNGKIKEKVYNSFLKENEKAKKIFNSPLYESLKLEGIKEAPINIAVLYNPPKKPTLGMTSFAKAGEYSVVCAVENMWLMARTLNLGMGWVSIVDEATVLEIVEAKEDAKLIAYLCVGYVDYFFDEPELKKVGWEEKKSVESVVKVLE